MFATIFDGPEELSNKTTRRSVNIYRVTFFCSNGCGRTERKFGIIISAPTKKTHEYIQARLDRWIFCHKTSKFFDIVSETNVFKIY